MVYKGRGRERMGMGGGGGVETDRQTETEDEEGGEDRRTDGERHTETVAFKSCCFSTVLQVTAAEVKLSC